MTPKGNSEFSVRVKVQGIGSETKTLDESSMESFMQALGTEKGLTEGLAAIAMQPKRRQLKLNFTVPFGKRGSFDLPKLFMNETSA